MVANLKKSMLAIFQLPFFFVAQFVALTYLVLRNKIKIIHAHWLVPQGLLAVILKIFLKVDVIVSIHGSDIFLSKYPIMRLVNRFVIQHADVVTANSSATKAEALKIVKNKDVYVIPMGVDTNYFVPVTSSYEFESRLIRLLYVGRLIDWKGVVYLIRSIPMIKKGGVNVKLTIVGDGTQKNELMALVRELRLEDSVKFVGEVAHEETLKYYQSSDLLVVPSIIKSSGETEGLGVVILEAMSCGLPVVGSRVGGIVDIIQDGVNGFMVDQKKPEKIADVVLEFVKYVPDERLKLKRMARQTVLDRFSWEIIAQQFEEVYNLEVKNGQ